MKNSQQKFLKRWYSSRVWFVNHLQELEFDKFRGQKMEMEEYLSNPGSKYWGKMCFAVACERLWCFLDNTGGRGKRSSTRRLFQ